MISKEREAEILRLYYAEKWKEGTISRELGVHKSVVRRVLAQESMPRPCRSRPRMVDPFLPFIVEMIEKYPRLTATRLHDMVRQRGYKGQSSQFRAIISELRPRRRREPFLRLKTLPGEQAQVDWAHFGHLQYGKARRPLVAFVMVLSYSRAIFVRFFLSQNLSSFLYGHEFAFQWFGGVARVCLYDNCKTVVLERVGSAIRFNAEFCEYAGACRFEPRPVAVARGNEKGRVERAIQYIRTSFFAARRFTSLEDLNSQALSWCESASLARPWPDDTSRSVRDAFLEERGQLLPLPSDRYACEERCEVNVDKTPYVRFDLNDYSVPPTFVHRTLTLRATLGEVRILDGATIVATHERSYDRGRTVENKQHLEDLTRLKLEAGQHRRTHLLAEVVPSSAKLLQEASQRNQPLGRQTSQLQDLLEAYGASALEMAIQEALSHGAPHVEAVRHILERKRQEAGKPAALPLPLPEEARLRGVAVKPHCLASYNDLMGEQNDESDE